MESTERFKMKTLLAGIDALLLATGAASAEIKSERGFDCGRVNGGFSIEKTTKDATLMFEVNFSDNRERHLPSEEIVSIQGHKLLANALMATRGIATAAVRFASKADK
jgi:hypothetical protein